MGNTSQYSCYNVVMGRNVDNVDGHSGRCDEKIINLITELISEVFLMYSDEVHDIQLSTVPSFPSASVMTNVTHKLKNKNRKVTCPLTLRE